MIQPPVDAAISALAARQHGVLDLDQLLALGLSARAVQKRTAAGRLHRIHHGVYSLTPRNLLQRESFWLAAVFACGDGTVLSHRSAAALHGLRQWGGATIEVTVPGRTHRKRVGIRAHRSTTLAPEDTTVVNNIPCTTVARTLLNLAEAVDRRRLEKAFDQSEILEKFDQRAINDQLARNATQPAAKAVKALLSEHYAGSTPTWSELEDEFLGLMRSARIPLPEINAWIVLPDGGPAIRGDFVWRQQRLIIETDGHETHRTRQAFERDRRRDQRAVVAGWRVIRVTWRQLKRAPEEVVATILALLNLEPRRQPRAVRG